MKILYIGTLRKGSTSGERMKSFVALKHNVSIIDTYAESPKGLALRFYHHLGFGPFISRLNMLIKKKAVQANPDIIWIDKGVFVTADTLKFLNLHTKAKIIHLNPDDPFGMHQKGWRVFFKAIPYYDLHFVSRPQNVVEYQKHGAKRVLEYDRSYSPLMHKPTPLAPEDAHMKCTVGFVGSFAKERAEYIYYLVQNDVPIVVYGSGWEQATAYKNFPELFRGPVFGAQYAKALSGMDIALHFLRKENRDFQDSRTFEIPACGSFMLAQRSYKHEEFFEENKEVVFFDSKEELLMKVKYYLQNQRERQTIAGAGYIRVTSSGYDHRNRLSKMLNEAMLLFNAPAKMSTI